MITPAELEAMRLADEEIEREFDEEIRAYQRKYYEANKEAVAERQRKYREANKEAVAERDFVEAGYHGEYKEEAL